MAKILGVALAGVMLVAAAPAGRIEVQMLQFVQDRMSVVKTGQDLMAALRTEMPGGASRAPRIGDLFLGIIERNLSGEAAVHDQLGWYPDPDLAILVPFLKESGFVAADRDPDGKRGATFQLLTRWSPDNRGIRGVGPGPWGQILTALADNVRKSAPQLAAQAPEPIDQRALTRLILTDRFGPNTADRLLTGPRTGLDTREIATRLFAKPYKRGSTRIDPTFASRVFDAASMRALEWLMSNGEVGGYGTAYTGFDRPGPVTIAGWTREGQDGLDAPRWQGEIDAWVQRMRQLGLWVGMTPPDIAALEAATRRQHEIEAGAAAYQARQGGPF